MDFSHIPCIRAPIRIYNVCVTSQLVFTSRELVKKKAAPVGEWLATFTLFPLSPVQQAGDNGTEKLLITLERVSCSNYFISIEIIRCSVRLIKITKPDEKQSVEKTPRETNNGCLIPRMRTSSWGSILRVSHLSHKTRSRH